MNTLTKITFAFFLTVSASSVLAEAEQAAEKKKFHINEVFSTEQPEIKKKSRLRFKSDGPTCMCAGGLTEKDIENKKTEQSKE